MEKPITLRRAEFMQMLAQAINESKLPAFVIADCLTLTKIEMDKLATQQLQMDKEEWDNYCAKQKELNDDAVVE